MLLNAYVDTGKRKAGLCLTDLDGNIVHATLVEIKTVRRGNMARALIREAEKFGTIKRWTMEKPRFYADKTEFHADLQTLIDVINDMKKMVKGVKTVYPSAWKGNVPKPVCSRRIDRAITSLEKSVIGEYQHDKQDAVGIALVCEGRLKRGCRK